MHGVVCILEHSTMLKLRLCQVCHYVLCTLLQLGPGHADYTYRIKYNGFVAQSGGGRASARETIGRVAAVRHTVENAQIDAGRCC